MFLLRSDGMPPADRRLLAAVARVVLRGDLGDLAAQLQRSDAVAVSPRTMSRSRRTAASPEHGRVDAGARPRRSSWRTALGGFTPDGREYVVVLDGDRETPLPWSNVLANPTFGTMVSAVGRQLHLGGQQPREPADAVCQRSARRSDRRGDLSARRGIRRGVGRHTGAAAAAGRRRAAGSFVMRAGVTRYQHAVAGLEQELTVFVAPDDPVKVAMLTLTNTSTRPRGASACSATSSGASARPAPASAASSSPSATTDRRAPRAQPLQHGVRDRVAFWHATERARRRTPAIAREFVGRNRTLGQTRGALPRPARRPQRRRPRSVRRAAASMLRARARRVAPHRVRARPGARPGPRARARGALLVARAQCEAALDESRAHRGTRRSARCRCRRRTTRSI